MSRKPAIAAAAPALSALLLLLSGCGQSTPPEPSPSIGETARSDEPKPADWPLVATFSIVAVDPDTGELGVAVQSRIVAVGAVVPYAEAGVGAVATQAAANPRYGPLGLALLHKLTPEEVIDLLISNDSRAAIRQVAMITPDGQVAAHTGAGCLDWAGHRVGEGYSVQGNILAGEAVVAAMAEAFEDSAGEVLAERLLRALEAGQGKGGDRRGRQSAAMLIVREGWGYGGGNDRFRDLRVDEHDTPIAELRRVYEKHRELFPRP